MAQTSENPFALTPVCFNDSINIGPSETKHAENMECDDKFDPLVYCRTCATADPRLVPIFKGEGISHQLNKKIEKYLPIHVSPEDDLPVQLCYHCASTLIAWDALVVGCVEAERKLKLLQNSQGNESDVQIKEEASDGDCGLASDRAVDSDDEPLITKKFSIRKATKRKGKRRKETTKDKTDLQKSTELDRTEAKRLTGEPDLPFTSYQRYFGVKNSLITELLESRMESATGCNMCTAFRTIKSIFPKKTFECTMCSPFGSPDLESDFEMPNNDEFFSEEPLAKRSERNRRAKAESALSPAVCEECGKTLSSKISLNNHKKIHSKEKAMTCHVCGRAFRHRFNLVRHLRVIHEGMRGHVCADCGKCYRSQGELEDHRNIHEVRLKIICEDCGRTFLTKASFYTHKKTHKMKKSEKDAVRFGCSECEKTFTTKKSRNQHLLIHTGEKPIECTVCDKQFRTQANFRQHLKVHSNVKPFECEHCAKRFGRRDHLTIHVRVHTGEKPFVCNTCGRGFAQMTDMKKHSKIHEKVYPSDADQGKSIVFRPSGKLSSHRIKKVPTPGRRGCSKSKENKNVGCDDSEHPVPDGDVKKEEEEGSVSYQCPICRKTFGDTQVFCADLYSHLGKELKTEPGEKSCKICNQTFEESEHLTGHILLHIDDKRKDEEGSDENTRVPRNKKDKKVDDAFKSTCEICGKTISKKYTMKRHMETHSGEKKFTCHHCGKQYAQESGLQRHMLVIHEGVRKYKCPICARVFRSNSELKSHQDTHVDPRPFQCDQCGKTFKSQKHLYHHRKYHHTANGLRELCKICNRYFSSPSVLKRHHKVIHLGLKEFQCHVCSAQLSTKQYLQEHLRIHTDERPEVCSFCGKTFQMTGNLRQHMKTHMEKTQICYVCGKGFTRRCHLVIHMGSHRGLEQPQCDQCNQVFLLKSDLEKHLRTEHSYKQPGENYKEVQMEVFKEILVPYDSNNRRKSSDSRSIGTEDTESSQTSNESKPGIEEIKKEKIMRQSDKYDECDKTDDGKWKCETCSSLFSTQKCLDQHKVRIHQAKFVRHRCEYCTKTYRDAKKCERHTLLSHVLTLQCDECDKRYSKKLSVLYHKLSEHGGKRYSCNQCDKTYKLRDSYVLHLRTKHSNTSAKKYICDVCGKGFDYNRNLCLHMRTHTGERPFVCEVCGATSATSGNLKKHKATHHSEQERFKFACHLCNKKFVAKYNMEKHVRVAHDGRRDFTCQNCESSFTTKQAMRDHLLIHSGEKPFMCKICGLRVRSKPSLYKHNKTHTNNYPFPCGLCGKTFRLKSNLKKHSFSHLNGERNQQN